MKTIDIYYIFWKLELIIKFDALPGYYHLCKHIFYF